MRLVVIALLWASLAYGVEKRVKVAIIDSGTPKGLPAGALCEEGGRDFTGAGPEDKLGHATAVACLLAQGLDFKKTCILPIKYIHAGESPKERVVNDTWWAALLFGARYVNYSSSGPVPVAGESDVISTLVKDGIVIVAAAGNHDRELGTKSCEAYPACYHVVGVRVAGSLNAKGGKARYSNWGDPVTDWVSDSKGPGCGHFTGTSAAAPKVLNAIMKKAGLGLPKAAK